jgi:hypothetical protein
MKNWLITGANCLLGLAFAQVYVAMAATQVQHG